MNNILTFEDVLKQTDSNKRFLLLGNGFSIAYDSNRFSFTSLLKSAIEKNIIEENSPIHKMFDRLKTADFEYIMRLLEDTNKIINCYLENENLEIQNRLKSDSENLKEYLVDMITNNHPDKITEVEDNRFINTMNFIEKFEKIYTLNYDLLLYWSLIKLNEIKQTDVFRDGFGKSKEDSSEIVYKNKADNNRQNLFYLHGALHLYDKGTDFLKITYQPNKPLREQILNKLNKNTYPIFISEGTAENKKQKIIHNAYLNSAYKSLQTIRSVNSSLVLFGTMLKSNDEHIKTAILDNGVKKLYIGINPKKIDKHEMYIITSEFNSKEKKVFFYDYKTVNLW